VAKKGENNSRFGAAIDVCHLTPLPYMQKPKKETIRTANACNSIWLSKHSDKIGRLFVCKDKQTDSELFIRGEQKKKEDHYILTKTQTRKLKKKEWKSMTESQTECLAKTKSKTVLFLREKRLEEFESKVQHH
jgi:hypothetical protein